MRWAPPDTQTHMRHAHAHAAHAHSARGGDGLVCCGVGAAAAGGPIGGQPVAEGYVGRLVCPRAQRAEQIGANITKFLRNLGGEVQKFETKLGRSQTKSGQTPSTATPAHRRLTQPGAVTFLNTYTGTILIIYIYIVDSLGDGRPRLDGPHCGGVG